MAANSTAVSPFLGWAFCGGDECIEGLKRILPMGVWMTSKCFVKAVWFLIERLSHTYESDLKHPILL